jgi:hypothetical protein
MKRRQRYYYLILHWTSLPLLVLMWLMLITGPGLFKGEILRKTTLGLVNPATAGKWHSVWLPPLAAVVLYTHTTLGLEVMVGRTRWLKPKALWEIVALVVGLLGLAQFMWLYYG